MVLLQTVQLSNAHIRNLPQGLVALFIGATSGIGQSTLQHFAQNAPSPRIYTVARSQTAASHEQFLSSLRESSPSGTYNLIKADISLVSEVDKVVSAVDQEEKIDILFMSAGFIAFEGRKNTAEGLDPSMTTRYYSRLRAVQQLLPKLNKAASPRIVSVLAGGMEAPINEGDLDLRNSGNWSFWNASVHAATMGTLALELLARENPRLSIVHSAPGLVMTPGLARAQNFGISTSGAMAQDESGARAVFLATSDRYSVRGGLVPVLEGLGIAEKSVGGIFIVDSKGDIIDNEDVLARMRERGVDKAIWNFTLGLFTDCTNRPKDEL